MGDTDSRLDDDVESMRLFPKKQRTFMGGEPFGGGGGGGMAVSGNPCSLMEGKKAHVCGFCLYDDKDGVNEDDGTMACEERKGLIAKLRTFINQNTGKMTLHTISKLCEDIVVTTAPSVDPSEWTASLIYEHFANNDTESDRLAWSERINGVSRLISSLENELGRKRKASGGDPDDEGGAASSGEVQVQYHAANMYLKSIETWTKLQRLRPKINNG
jgi:hypothetical protein